MSDGTGCEQSLQNLADWQGEGDAPAYPIYEGRGLGALGDKEIH